MLLCVKSTDDDEFDDDSVYLHAHRVIKNLIIFICFDGIKYQPISIFYCQNQTKKYDDDITHNSLVSLHYLVKSRRFVDRASGQFRRRLECGV